MLNILFPFVTGMYVARKLLPDMVGKVAYAQNIAQYFVILSFLGIPTYGLREISKLRNDKDKLSKVYSELMIINAVSTFTCCIIYMMIVLYIKDFRENLILYLIAGVAIPFNFLNNSWLYEGMEDFKYISIRNIAFKLLCFLALVFLVNDKNDYLIYALITVLGTAGNYIVNIINSRKYVSFTIRSLSIKRHMKTIFMLVLVNLAIEIYSLVDITMLGQIAAEKNVAYYSYANRIYRIVLQVINAFTIVVVPRMSLLYSEKKYEAFNNIISKALKTIFVLSIPIIDVFDNLAIKKKWCYNKCGENIWIIKQEYQI